MSGPRAGDATGPAGFQRGWWFDEAVPGATIVHPGGRTITADEHARLAWLTNNASDVHGDAHRAARTPFGEPLVLGALSAAIVLGLAAPATSRPEDAARGIGTGWERVDLVGLVLAGDTLRAVSRVRAVTPDGDGRGGIVTRSIEGRNQRDEVVVRVEETRWVAARG